MSEFKIGDPAPVRRGWRFFHCAECDHRWKWPSRDALSQSGESCPNCGEWCHPTNSAIDATIPVDRLGNLTVPYNWQGHAPDQQWAATAFHKIGGCFSDAYEQALNKLIDDYQLKCEELTAQQLAEVIRQALDCGDLRRLVVANHNPAHLDADGTLTFKETSQFIYTPYAREQELEARIERLEAVLKQHGIELE